MILQNEISAQTASLRRQTQDERKRRQRTDRQHRAWIDQFDARVAQVAPEQNRRAA